MDNTTLTTFLENEPLIETKSSLDGIENEIVGKSIYYGTGLTTAKAMSVGIPFDVLEMFLLAEKIRRHLRLERIIQLIADAHALSNTFVEPNKANALSQAITQTMGQVAKAVANVNSFIILRSSDLAVIPEYDELYRSITTDDHEYVRREWTDILYLKKRFDLAVKLSWIIDPKAKKVGYDERLFDLRFREITGESMSFIYALPGRTLDADRPKASPYITIPGEKRIMLDPDERVKEKLERAKDELSEKMYNTLLKHLSHIVELFGELTGERVNPNSPAHEQVNTVLKSIFK